MKCRLMKFLSTSFLRCLVYVSVCLSLCLGFISSSASATNYGNFHAASLSYYARSSSGYLGSRTLSFNSSDRMSPGTTLAFNSDEKWYDVCMRFTGLQVTTDSAYYLLTFGMNIQSPRSPLYAPLGGMSSSTNTNVLNNVVNDTLSANNTFVTSTGRNFTTVTHSITGIIDGSSGDTLCFEGVFLGSADYVQITRPTLSTYKSYDELTKNAVVHSEQLLGEIRDLLKSVEQNASVSGVIDATNNQTQQIIANGQQAHQDSQAQLNATNQQTDAINNQTKQDKDQYDQEKQEEQEREESAKKDGDGLLGIFNITILNPFASIWEMFNSGGCTSIPTIAGWVGSNDTTYCSWWPQSIRATLTPVFSLASMMLLFGFVARWLGGSEGFSVRVDGLSKGV